MVLPVAVTTTKAADATTTRTPMKTVKPLLLLLTLLRPRVMILDPIVI